MSEGSVLAIAHRAGNSLADLRQAIDLGADVIEADVNNYQGRLEIHHLKTMGPLPWLWDRWELHSVKAPRLGLAELLRAAGDGVTFMLDIKGKDAATGQLVAQQLHAHAPERPVLVCSRYWPVLTAFESIPWVRILRSARNRTELAPLLAQAPPPAGRRGYGASVHRSLLTSDVVSRLHDRLDVVMTWPINDDAALEQVLGLRQTGTVGVISDEPAVLRRLLATRG
jgi:glycerophosphoryl diester phosphodiesterase